MSETWEAYLILASHLEREIQRIETYNRMARGEVVIVFDGPGRLTQEVLDGILDQINEPHRGVRYHYDPATSKVSVKGAS